MTTVKWKMTNGNCALARQPGGLAWGYCHRWQPYGGSMLNVLVQQLYLISLLAQFYSHEITHREHSHPALAIYDRQMPGSDPFHSLERLTRSFVASDYCT